MKFFTLLLALASTVIAVNVERQQTSSTIPGKYIAVLKSDSVVAKVLQIIQSLVTINDAQAAALKDFKAVHQYSLQDFKGFSFEGNAVVIAALKAVGESVAIEPDRLVYASAPIVEARNPQSSTAQTEVTAASLLSQTGAPWGLGRISHRAKGSKTYIYDNTAGSGAYAYVIDTGVNAAHQEFEGRATQAINFVTEEANEDLNGHGTHCSGTIGAKTYGVAKKIRIIGVKVLNSGGAGSISNIIAGVNWAVNDAVKNGRQSKSVISMSLGGGYSSSFNSAIASAIKSGVFVAVAAGNDNQNAANYSPASEASACTIGATDINDKRASFSNYGSVVDVFAPGVDITSTWIGSTSAINTISGTSMATPHVAGLAAYFQILKGARSPQSLCSYIASSSTKFVISGVPFGTNNYLAYNNNGS